MRNLELTTDEYYHAFNHGIDDRNITIDQYDSDRFVQCLKEFNSVDLTGSIYEKSFIKNNGRGDGLSQSQKLVDIISYCLNPNHFHLLLKQNIDGGIGKFLHRLTMGYSKYYNARYHRKGSLFRGTFKAIHIDTEEQLLYTMAYVAYNDKIHKLGHLVSKLVRSNASYLETLPGDEDLKIIIDQFNSKKAYQGYVKDVIEISQRAKEDQDEFDED